MVHFVVEEVADRARVDVRVLLHVAGEVGHVLPAPEDVGGGGGGDVTPVQLWHDQGSPPGRQSATLDNVGVEMVAPVDDVVTAAAEESGELGVVTSTVHSVACLQSPHLSGGGEEARLAGVHHHQGEVGDPARAQEEGHDLVGVPPVAVGQQEGLLLTRPQPLQQAGQSVVPLDVLLGAGQAGRLQLE